MKVLKLAYATAKEIRGKGLTGATERQRTSRGSAAVASGIGLRQGNTGEIGASVGQGTGARRGHGQGDGRRGAGRVGVVGEGLI